MGRLLSEEYEAIEALRRMSSQTYGDVVGTLPGGRELGQATRDVLCAAGCGSDRVRRLYCMVLAPSLDKPTWTPYLNRRQAPTR